MRTLLEGERKSDQVAPGPDWTLRVARAPMTFNGVLYPVNATLPAEEIVASANFPSLMRTRRVVWREPTYPAGPPPRELPPPTYAKPNPPVVIIDKFVDQVANWRATLA